MNLTTEAKTLMAIGIATVLLLVGAVFFLNRESSNIDSANSAPVDQSKLIREDSWQTNPNGKVTIVEFLDYECEACGAAHPILKEVKEKYGDQINLVVRHFPNHFNSIAAANAVEVAGEQGKYWDMHNKVFESQTEWSEQRSSQDDKFLQYATEMGLNMDQFKQSFEAKKFTEKINRDKNEGLSIGVDATPTFFVNGAKKVGVLSLAEWTKIIDEELTK